ncbi:hypothetical protein PSTT_01662, partial [Puccinia striiformis]
RIDHLDQKRQKGALPLSTASIFLKAEMAAVYRPTIIVECISQLFLQRYNLWSVVEADHNPTIQQLTGGSRGIGLSCLEILLKSPIRANVVSLSRSFPAKLLELKKSYHDNLLVVQGDVKNDEDNKRAVESAIKTFGSIDGLILNSGIIHFERIDKNKSLEAWREVFDSISGAQKGESCSSVLLLLWKVVHHGASKAAMNSLCRTLAAEEPEITSISLRPGVTDTDMQEELRSKGKDIMTPTIYQSCYDLYASSKIVRPERPAEVIVNLSIRADRELTGKFLVWDDEELKTYRSSC